MSNKLFSKLFINNFKSKPVIYLFIIIGMLISNTLLLIFGDFYFNSSSELSDREFTSNRVSFVFYEKPDYPLLTAQIENEKGITNAILSCQRQTGNDNITISAYKTPNLHKSRFISGSIDTDVKEGTFICSSEYAHGVESEKNIKIKVGSKINIDDMEMICSGIYLTSDFDILINENEIGKIEKATQYSFAYVFNNKKSISDLESLNTIIKNKHNPIFITYPKETQSYTFGGLLSALGPNLLLVIIAIINFMFIYVFMIRKRFYTYSILKLCGLTTLRTRLLLVFESELLFVISYILSIPTYVLLSPLISGYKIILSTLNLQLILSFIIMQTLNIVIFLAVTRRIVKKNPIELFRESVVE